MTVTSKTRNTEAAKPHWLEWATGIISALVVMAMIGWIGGEAVLEQETAPEFRSKILSIQPVKDGFRINFEIFNDGTSTAAAVQVRGELLQDGRPAETAEASFDYVPGQSSSRGGLLFTQDPQDREISIRAIGYTEP